MKRCLYGALLTIAAFCCAAEDRPSFNLANDAHIDITDHMSIYEAWNSMRPTIISSGDALAMLYVLDSESAPFKSGRQLLAIVIVGQAGTGVEPVAFRITAPTTKIVHVVPGSKGKFDYFSLFVGDNEEVRLDVLSNGQVTLGGHKVGVIR